MEVFLIIGYINMKIKELLYKTPEMTEERLLEIMKSHEDWIKGVLKNRLFELHKELPLNKAILKEYDLIQDKKSYLTKSQREEIYGFVGVCMIEMTKKNEDTSEKEYTEFEEVNDGTAG